MKPIHQGLVTLLRSAVTGEKLTLPEDFSLEEADGLIRSQSLLTMAYRGAYQCGISPKTELMQRYKQLYFLQMIHSEQQMRALDRIFAAFEANGIDYLPLKGSKLKSLYPQPELRTMGDADILIRLEQYAKIRPVMVELGFQEEQESAHELCWRSSNLYVELHKCLYAPQHTQLRQYYGIGWERAMLEQGHRWTLRPEDEYIFIFTHMTKHFLFSGIGARQILDLQVYQHAHPELDEANVKEAMTRLGFAEFFHNIQRTLRVWFEDASADEITDCITEFIFSGGSFGTEENRFLSNRLRGSGKGQISNSKAKSLTKTLFLPLREMQISYRILYKHPILLPIFWVVRWFDVLIHRRKNIGKKFRIIRDMNDEKVTQHQKMMEFMGLRYDYQFGKDE